LADYVEPEKEDEKPDDAAGEGECEVKESKPDGDGVVAEKPEENADMEAAVDSKHADVDDDKFLIESPRVN
jgi:hypothetical protein